MNPLLLQVRRLILVRTAVGASGDKKFKLLILLIGLTFFTLSCTTKQTSPRNEAPTSSAQPVVATAVGSITIDILQSGRPEYYWHFDIEPAKGTVRQVSEQQFTDYKHERIPMDFARPAGTITSCGDKPVAESPDRRWYATCIEKFTKTTEFGGTYGYSFVVFDASTNIEVMRWSPTDHRNIRGFAWSPDSKTVGVLNLGEYYGRSPSERLSGWAGHPVPHHTVYFDIFEVGGWKQTEYRVKNEVISAFTRILRWQ